MIEEENDEVNQLIEYLIEAKALEINGYDSIGDQFTYKFTPKIKEIMPELFEEHFAFINQIAFDLWNKGIIEVKFDENKGPMVFLKDVDHTRSIAKELPEDERFFLENMLNQYDLDNGVI